MNEKDKMSPAGRHGAMFAGRGDRILVCGFHAAPPELGVMMDAAGYKHGAPVQVGAEAFCKATSSMQDNLWAFLRNKGGEHECGQCLSWVALKVQRYVQPHEY